MELVPPPVRTTQDQQGDDDCDAIAATLRQRHALPDPGPDHGAPSSSASASARTPRTPPQLPPQDTQPLSSTLPLWWPFSALDLPEPDDLRTATFADTAVLCLPRTNVWRRFAMWVVLLPEFDQFIFVVIIYNTVLLGFADYSHIYTDPEDASKPLGDLDPHGSLRNALLLGSEAPLA